MHNQLIEDYRAYLKNTHSSTNTVKNYVSDLSTFVDYLKTQNQYFSLLTLPFILSSRTLLKYSQSLEESLPRSSANRHLAGLKKFTKFAISQNLIDANYVGEIRTIPSSPEEQLTITLDNYKIYLQKHGYSTNTVKGYLSDIKYHLSSGSTSSAHSDSTTARKSAAVHTFLEWRDGRQISHLPDTTLVSQKQNLLDFPSSDSFKVSGPTLSLSYLYDRNVWRFICILLGLIALVPFSLKIVDYRSSSSSNSVLIKNMTAIYSGLRENDRYRSLHDLVFKTVPTKIISFSLNPSDEILSPVRESGSVSATANQPVTTVEPDRSSGVLGSMTKRSILSNFLNYLSSFINTSINSIQSKFGGTIIDPTQINTE